MNDIHFHDRSKYDEKEEHLVTDYEDLPGLLLKLANGTGKVSKQLFEQVLGIVSESATHDVNKRRNFLDLV